MIAGRRKELKMSQKDVAVRVKKEDGQGISVQYLNDVEHGRRKPPSDLMIRQLAKILKLPLDALYFSAARLPPDIKIDKIDPERAAAAYKAFRLELKDKSEKK
jgi:transcriptional regulator with XRE-family HTH domain